MESLCVVDETKLERFDARQGFWRRKLAGVRLALCILGLIIYLPFCLLGWLCKFLGALLLWPAGKILFFSFVELVRLWYVHSFGRLHLKLSEVMRRKSCRRPHSRSIRVDVRSRGGRLVSVHSLAQLMDNYGYLIVNRETKQNELGEVYYPAVIIDCADAEACRTAIDAITHVHYGIKLSLEAILTTHHHWDHQAGNLDLKKAEPTIKEIFGGHRDRVLGCNRKVHGGDRIEVAGGLVFDAIEVPCHTRGSLIYRLHGEGRRDALFTGDTLFTGGCGATFEGSPEEMRKNFTHLYLQNSPEALLFPGHEYAERILSDLFSSHVCELASQNPQRFFGYCTALCRVKHLRSLPFPAPTFPVKLKEEVMYNPNFEEVLRAIWALRTAVLRKEPQRQEEFWAANVQDLMGAVSPRRLHPDDDEMSSIKPRVAVDDQGTVVVVEPPWIMNGDLETPWVLNWKSDIDNLLLKFNKIPNESIRPVMYSQLTKLRSSQFPVDLEVIPPEFPTASRALGKLLRPLANPANPNAIAHATLETALLYNYGPLSPVSYVDFDHFVEKLQELSPKADELTRESSSSLYAAREFSFASLVKLVAAELKAKALLPTNLDYAKAGSKMDKHMSQCSNRAPSSVSAKEKNQLKIHVHDFTACRICQGECIEGVPSRPTLVHHSEERSQPRVLHPMLSTVVTTSLKSAPAAGRFGIVVPSSPPCEIESPPPPPNKMLLRHSRSENPFKRTSTTPGFKRKPGELVQAAQYPRRFSQSVRSRRHSTETPHKSVDSASLVFVSNDFEGLRGEDDFIRVPLRGTQESDEESFVDD